jgi:hypothetical protein
MFSDFRRERLAAAQTQSGHDTPKTPLAAQLADHLPYVDDNHTGQRGDRWEAFSLLGGTSAGISRAT